MATAKSDDESDAASHPLAENRPGVYVQVVSPRRRKKGKRGASGSSHPPAEAEARSTARQGKARGGVREETDARVTAREGSDPRAEVEADVSSAPSEKKGASTTAVSQAPARMDKGEVKAPSVALSSEPAARTTVVDAGAGEVDDEDDGRQSGERPVDFESVRARDTESENTNDRPELLGLSLPPPPRLPSFSSPIKPQSEIETDPPAHSASLLDAPHTLRPVADSTPAARSSNTLLAFVGAFTAIIVMAGLVALRDVTKSKPAAGVQPSTNSAPLSSGAASVPAPRVEAPSAQPAPAPVASQAAPSADPALPLPTQQGKFAAKAAHPAAKQPAAKVLVAKAAAALRDLKNTGVQATPGAVSDEPEAAEDGDEDPVPGPDEPLELPVNPYR